MGVPERGGPLGCCKEAAFPVRETGACGRSRDLTCGLPGGHSWTGSGQGEGREASWGPSDMTSLDQEFPVEVKAVPTERGFS